MTIIFIFCLATLALRVSGSTSAVQTPSTPILLPATAVPTPFVGNTMSQCIRSCVVDAADANQCDSAKTCICTDPEFQQTVAACLQSRCSYTEEAALQLQHGTKCFRQLPDLPVSQSEQPCTRCGYTFGVSHGPDFPDESSSVMSSTSSLKVMDSSGVGHGFPTPSASASQRTSSDMFLRLEVSSGFVAVALMDLLWAI